MYIKIQIKNKTATTENTVIVKDNSDYILDFDFNGEFEADKLKTARIIKDTENYQDIPFIGTQVALPRISNARFISVGVFDDEVATTPVVLYCEKSILRGETPEPPTADVYGEIIDLMNDIKSDISEIEERKADKEAVYTKGEVDTKLSEKVGSDDLSAAVAEVSNEIGAKADKGEVYTKDEVDFQLANKADTGVLSSAVDYVNENLSAKVDKVEGMGLSQNSFTDEEKEKLASLTGVSLPEDIVRDGNYVHTDNNFTNEDKDKVHTHENKELLDMVRGTIQVNSDTNIHVFDIWESCTIFADTNNEDYWKILVDFAKSNQNFVIYPPNGPRFPYGFEYNPGEKYIIRVDTIVGYGGFIVSGKEKAVGVQYFTEQNGTKYSRKIDFERDEETGKVTYNYSDFKKITFTRDEISNQLGYHENPISGMAVTEEINKLTYQKAAKEDVYTKDEVDKKLEDKASIEELHSVEMSLGNTINIIGTNTDKLSSSKADKADTYTKSEVDSKIGDIDTALDGIIALENQLIGEVEA